MCYIVLLCVRIKNFAYNEEEGKTTLLYFCERRTAYGQGSKVPVKFDQRNQTDISWLYGFKE